MAYFNNSRNFLIALKGEQGNDGVTPLLMVSAENELYVSYDEGVSWEYLATLPYSNTIQAVSTPEEMDAILARETGRRVGSCYMYVGESTDDYTNGSVYRIKQGD